MKKIELVELNLQNFKGIKEYSLKANAQDLEMKGGNGSGKTTLFDGFTWLLFGKDSNDDAKFDIKELDQEGNVKQHGLDHSVEGIFNVDGKQVSFKRTYSEVWEKKSGETEKKFNGHTTKYSIDNLPAKKKEFDEKVQSIISDDVFKLVTNPLYFNESLDWKKRREILINIAGGITDQEIAKDDSELESFIERLNGNDVEKHKQAIFSKRKEFNVAIDKIPVRIDEINLNIIDLKEVDADKNKSDMTALLTKMDKQQEEINKAMNGTELNDKKKALSGIELELSNLKNEAQREHFKQVHSLKASIQEKQSNVNMLASDSIEKQIESNKNTIASIEKRMETMRERYKETNAEQPSHTEKCECPTCGQAIPEKQVKEAKEKALASFNKNKSDRLENLKSEGLAMTEEKQGIEKEIVKLQTKQDKQADHIKKEKAKIQQLQKELEALEGQEVPEDANKLEKIKRKDQLVKDIADLEKSSEASVTSKKEEMAKLDQEKKSLQEKQSQVAILEKSKNRIAELEAEEERLSREVSALDKELSMIEEYTRSKIDLLESKLNDKFKYARFRLFDKQINGGVAETCQTLFEGVPFKSLNSASKINIGIDIINTLNSHYAIKAPIFIDNAESVITLNDTVSQTIKLAVADVGEMKMNNLEENKTA